MPRRGGGGRGPERVEQWFAREQLTRIDHALMTTGVRVGVGEGAKVRDKGTLAVNAINHSAAARCISRRVLHGKQSGRPAFQARRRAP